MIGPRDFSIVKTGMLLLGTLFVLAGCGFKDRPVPPQEVVPRAVTDLRHQLSDKGVTLYWSYPIETVTGEDLTNISEFLMFRAVVPTDSYCETCPVPFGRPLSLPGGALPGEGRKTADYKATLLRPGNLYFFKVRSKNGWWAESADSNIVSFLWEIPALAPTDVRLISGDSQVELSWRPVTSHLDGSPTDEELRYQVYRSHGGRPFEKIGQPLAETFYADTRVVNGRTYYYQVQAISMYEQGAVGGGVSDSVGGTPVDITAPGVPGGVRGITTGVGVKVFWNHVAESDVKGYRVYRRTKLNEEPQLVGEVQLPYTMFIDREAPSSAKKLYYSVSSIDGREPANESDLSPEIMVTR